MASSEEEQELKLEKIDDVIMYLVEWRRCHDGVWPDSWRRNSYIDGKLLLHRSLKEAEAEIASLFKEDAPVVGFRGIVSYNTQARVRAFRLVECAVDL